MSHRTLGIVTNFPEEVFQSAVISGALAVAAERGYAAEVLAFPAPDGDFARLQAALPALSGLLVIANILSDAQLAELHARGLPITLASHYAPHLPVPAITSNNRQGIAMLMRHLVVDCARRRPILILGDMNQNDAKLRHQAYEQELMRYGLEIRPAYHLRGDFIPDVAAKSLAVFLESEPDFDSVFAMDYRMAIAALHVLRARGYRVPHDVAVVGYGDGSESEAAGLTTVRADITELGRRGARQLLGQVEGLKIHGLTLLSTELVVRSTTQPPTV
jgi:LacI family transcriptional regulator